MKKSKICEHCGAVMEYQEWADLTFNTNMHSWNKKKFCDSKCCSDEHRRRKCEKKRQGLNK